MPPTITVVGRHRHQAYCNLWLATSVFHWGCVPIIYVGRKRCRKVSTFVILNLYCLTLRCSVFYIWINLTYSLWFLFIYRQTGEDWWRKTKRNGCNIPWKNNHMWYGQLLWLWLWSYRRCEYIIQCQEVKEQGEARLLLWRTQQYMI